VLTFIPDCAGRLPHPRLVQRALAGNARVARAFLVGHAAANATVDLRLLVERAFLTRNQYGT
jgi:hypothetical protein